MPTREHPPSRHTGPQGNGDSRWDAIWQLVLQAEHLPAGDRGAYLQSVETDPFIIRQALAIVEGSESIATAADSLPLAEERFAPQPGQKIGRYRVGTLLGSGGAGTVYAAFDEELNRPVAIKFVSSRRMANPDAPASHLREARNASALNHPNIIVVHEVIETGETAAIVMELVKGLTLREAARREPPLNEVLRWSTQLAHALATAHDHGLVHGDIKPENVMVRDDGYIKLLDFGLALDSAPATAAGSQLVGTLRYLAPERCFGKSSATQAGDIFAFGVLLYELTAGRYPYESQSTLALLPATSDGEAPRARKFRHDLPAALDHLIAAMLARHPEDRPSARQVADKLTESSHLTPRRSMSVWFAVAGALSLVTLLVLAYRSRNPLATDDFSRMTVRPVASQPGLEDSPSISPDGIWISYLYRARAADHPKLQVHSLDGGAPIEVDTGELVVQGPAAWSPDSSELAFEVLESPHDHAIYRVKRTGGGPRRIAGCKSQTSDPCEVDWSPRGTTLAVTDHSQDKSELYLIDLKSGRQQQLIVPEKEHLGRPRFSPDGNWIAYSKSISLQTDDLYVVSASGGQPRRITRNPWYEKGFAWSKDGKGLVAISSRLSHTPEIFQFPLDGGEPYRVGELDVTRGTEPTLSRAKGSLAWVRDLSSNSIWRMPVDQSQQAPQTLTESAAVDSDPEWSSNGRLVFRSNRSGFDELWIAGADGSQPWQATRFRGPFVGDPHWSPDGESIAFTCHTNGNPDIYLMQCATGAPSGCSEPRQMTNTPSIDANPTWSSDGRWIYFSSSRSSGFEVWRMPADGGAAERITWNGGYLARESADGKWLYYSKYKYPVTGFWRIALPASGPGQQETPIAQNVPFRAAGSWALGAHELFYYPAVEDRGIPFPSVRAIDIQTKSTRDLPLGNIRLGRGLSLSRDGRWMLYSQNERAVTLVMVAERGTHR